MWSTPTTAPRPKCLLDTRALETGRVSAADRERQERQRQFTAGVSTFEWLADGEHLLVPLAGQILLLRLDGSHTALALPRGEIGDLRASPLGTYLTYVADNDLFVFRRDTGEEIRITHDGSECVSNGLAEFIAQEEMHRFEGYWWAPDERRLIFTRVDSSTIPVSHRLEVVADDVTAIAQRYAFAGGPNARVALLEFDLRTGTTTALDIGLGETDYLARVSFVGDMLTVQVQNRAQNRLELRGEDEKGFCTWLVETSDTWINLHDNLRAMADGRYVWTSERDGLARLYVARIDASQPPVPVTPDDLHVTAVLGSHGSTVWLQGWREQPTERHVYQVQVPSGSLTCLTTGSRWNDATVHPESGQLARVVSDFTTPPYLLLASGGGESTLARVAADHPCHSIERVPAVFGTLAAADGQTLHWRMTAPLAVHRGSGGRHPVIVYVYGGPGAQRVCNAWPPMLVHLLSHAGYGVLELDNRGSANRGRTFEAPIFHHMGEVEVADQVTALSVLERFPWADADRIGVHGHSYGGYMTLMCLCKAGDRFKAGVAGAPVADWRLYDTHYTERYLGNPAEDLTPYEMSSVLPCLERLARPLLLVHGMADDNVLFTHSTRLMRELQRLGKPFELMTYPGSRHALQEKDVSLHRLHHLLDFFDRHL
ncbi:MAG: alpha/beta fold hydrolase [Pseudomonadales bacterium]